MTTISTPPKNSIHILPPHIAERIAAGEVVERPSSVVKELIENSIDAHSTHIHVHLEEGGKSLIEITDNGTGMAPEDLNLCLFRHATSKISAFEDLEHLTSLGFRGEALAALSAVASLEILSRTKDQESCYKLTSFSIQENFKKALPFTYGHFLGSHHGTKIKVENIFSQIPARLKFLKSARGEVAAVKEWMEKLSLTCPEIRFQLTHHDKTLLDLHSQKIEERIQILFQEYDTFPIKKEEIEYEGFQFTGYWFEGMSAPSTKNIIQIINQRAIKDRVIQQALLSPFKQSLLPGRFPGIVLFIQCDPSVVDFNVHPTKMELRFENPSSLFHGIQKLGEKLLGLSTTSWSTMHRYTESQNKVHYEMHTPEKTLFYNTPQLKLEPLSLNDEKVQSPSPITPSLPPQKKPPDYIQSAQFSGILLATYIALENPHEVILIDQHAAHERIRYEKLKKQILNEKNIPSQTLLLPHTLHIPKEDVPQLLKKCEALIHFGFELELFDEETLLIRGVPSAWGIQNIPQRIKNILDNFSLESNSPQDILIDENLFEKIASEACHSSVRAHDRLEKEEAQSLILQLFQCDHPWNCPHGRPTLVRLPEKKIEEWFLRKI